MRRYLLPVAMIAGIIGVYFASPAIAAAIAILQSAEQALVVTVVVAVALQLAGHVFRAKRTKLILDQAAKSSDRFQFAALSIGYLFNALLPFRIGEAVRAFVIARRLRISFLYTFASVVIERAVDVLLLGVLVIIGAGLVGGQLAYGVAVLTFSAMLFAAAVLTAVWLLMRENRKVLTLTWRMTGWFNASITNSLRFKVWSLIFGLQQFFRNRSLVRRYAAYAGLSWLMYGVSAWLLAMVVLGDLSPIEQFVSGITPYVVSIPTWGILQAAEYTQFSALLSRQPNDALLTLGILSWVVLVFPMAAIGLVTLFVLRVKRAPVVNLDEQSSAFVNKLSRHEDISQAFPGFLDSYFSGNQLAMILHRLEASNNLRLVRYFKGGSDAITVLVLEDDRLFVKKIIPKRYQDRLKAQYDWLKRHEKMDYLVKVIGEQDMEDFYSIDLEYDPKFVPFFEYLHHSSEQQALEVISTTWNSLYGHLHKKAKAPKYLPKRRDQFVDKHIWGCVELAAQTHDDIGRVLTEKTIMINGIEYDNLNEIMAKIKRHKQAWRDIATFRESDYVHGDPSIDNILVAPDTGEPLIIDPAPDGNLINGPVFDMGKLLQSFYCGYEFLFRDEDPIELGTNGAINYRDQRSERYLELCQYIQEELSKEFLTEEEQRSLLFHAGTLLIRRLKHQVHSYPQNSLKMYAVGVKTLNDFYAQYDAK
jgi:hypothetical protein